MVDGNNLCGILQEEAQVILHKTFTSKKVRNQGWDEGT